MEFIEYYVVYWRDENDNAIHSANFSGCAYSNKCGFVRNIRNNGALDIETHCYWSDGTVTKVKE